MKRITILLLILASILQAQPVLTASNFPAEYSCTAYRGNSLGFTNGSAGANQVWDYSAITLVETNYTITRIPITEMPFYDQFPAANFCEKQNDNGLISYSAANLNSSTFETMGYVDDNNHIVRYSDTNLVFQFPYTFNTTFNDTYLPDSPGATLRSFTRTYDAYGTLITPFGTFTDVIRQKIENIFAGGIGYVWIESNSFQVILSGNFDDTLIYFFKDTTNLGVNQNESQVFSIYPNPTQGDFTIHNDNELIETFVNVYDVLGKILIANEKLNEDFKNISLKDFNPGLYIVKITDSENQILHTQKMIKN